MTASGERNQQAFNNRYVEILFTISVYFSAIIILGHVVGFIDGLGSRNGTARFVAFIGWVVPPTAIIALFASRTAKGRRYAEPDVVWPIFLALFIYAILLATVGERISTLLRSDAPYRAFDYSYNIKKGVMPYERAEGYIFHARDYEGLESEYTMMMDDAGYDVDTLPNMFDGRPYLFWQMALVDGFTPYYINGSLEQLGDHSEAGYGVTYAAVYGTIFTISSLRSLGLLVLLLVCWCGVELARMIVACGWGWLSMVIRKPH